jgi:hypothetical protein
LDDVLYANENHRIIAEAVMRWLAAATLEYDTIEEEGSPTFLLPQSRGFVRVSAHPNSVRDSVLIHANWLLVRDPLAGKALYEWALKKNTGLLFGRLTLDASCICLTDYIPDPMTYENFSQHILRDISDISRLRTEVLLLEG